jgi:hypothetical protein
MKIYTLPRTPGATETQEWTTFCHSREPFVVIDHDNYRSTSRWQHVDRKRKFSVTRFSRNIRMGGYLRGTPAWYATLAQAEAAAAKIVQMEREKYETQHSMDHSRTRET